MFCAEHVPWPFWFVFTGSTTFSTRNVRHGGVSAVQPFVNVRSCFVTSHTLPELFVSLKMAIVMVASLPGFVVFGKGKLGLVSMGCGERKGVGEEVGA